MATTTEILAAQTNWQAITATLEGNADWDNYIFEQLALASDAWTSDTASSMWEYTDGYKISFATATNADLSTSEAVWCFTNIADGQANTEQTAETDADGYYCVSNSNGLLSNISYYLSADLISGATIASPKWTITITAGEVA